MLLGPLACLWLMASFALVGLRVRQQGWLLPRAGCGMLERTVCGRW